MSLVLALLTSVGYGVSDYLAGRVARRVDPALLVLCSQTAQVGVVAVFTCYTNADGTPTR